MKFCLFRLAALSLFGLGAMAAGCGQKGPLVLPDAQKHHKVAPSLRPRPPAAPSGGTATPNPEPAGASGAPAPALAPAPPAPAPPANPPTPSRPAPPPAPASPPAPGNPTPAQPESDASSH
ncbi:MAG TPA: lipoprotein [Steroidobacteraceae bacterium]|nr:lipoprotein [Steroidobacteraceae bacterium]